MKTRLILTALIIVTSLYICGIIIQNNVDIMEWPKDARAIFCSLSFLFCGGFYILYIVANAKEL